MSRQEFGDWQTPMHLAHTITAHVAMLCDPSPAFVLEPTCGEGSFLIAAAAQFEGACLDGYELNEAYAARAYARLPPNRTSVRTADFFEVEWERILSVAPEPILVIGNPPWVTNSSLGSLESNNLPQKRNFKGLSGYEALTGKSNFDISEWMILRLLGSLQSRNATLAMLCKAAVARRVIEFAAQKGWSLGPGGLWRIDAKQHFDASVDAVLLVCKTGMKHASSAKWPVYPSLDAAIHSSVMSAIDGVLYADIDAQARSAHIAGECTPEWRSGIKHDCAKVMELRGSPEGWVNGFGELVQVEEHLVYPLFKSSDVAHGESRLQRALIVPQQALGEDTLSLKQRAPKAWAYLSRHGRLLNARKSSIYRGQPPFAIFGIGSYSFAPWKVAVSGLYKNCKFSVIGPISGRPVMLDDTCYFLPFEREEDAKRVLKALGSSLARDFLSARIFWDAKRPVSKSVLQQLDLSTLLAELRLTPRGAGRGEQVRLPL